MIKSALIIVPHQDDELNIGSSLLRQMCQNNIKVTVCYVTNGDYTGQEAVRLKEVKRTAKFFGGWNIVYLGYGDGGYEGSLYKAESDDMVVESHAGYRETHGVLDLVDFHYTKYCCHAKYSRRSMFQDIKDVILSISSDLVICIDSDEHPDHKIVSEFFDKAMDEIVKETSYKPIILKKYAYLGTWYGKNDYFFRPMLPTEKVLTKKLDKEYIINDEKWEKRIKFKVPESDFPLWFWKSPIYKAYRFYSSQNGALYFFSVVNSDLIYWYYEIKNKTLVLSSDFPLKETPFEYAEEKSGDSKISNFYYFIYRLYVFLFKGFLKIRRIVKYGV